MQAKYDKIAAAIVENIIRGKYSERLPAEQQLADAFNTTTLTVRKALDTLVNQGMIYKVPYVGTFIREEPERQLSFDWRSQIAAFGEDADILHKLIGNHFSNYEIIFQDKKNSNPPDLTLISSTTSFCYSESAMPFPYEVIERYRNDNYLQAPFNVHRLNNLYYALPVLYSPTALQINREAWTNLRPGTPEPDSISWEDIAELGHLAEKTGAKLWNQQTMAIVLRILIFANGDTGGELGRVDLEQLQYRINQLSHCLKPELICPWRYNQELIKATSRQSFRHEQEMEKWLLASPPPSPAGCVTWGAYVTVSPRCRFPKEALEVAEYLLSPEFQNFIGKHRIGLPVLKSAALDSLDLKHWHDELFYGAREEILTNNASEQEFLLRLDSFVNRLISGGVQVEKLSDFLCYEISVARHRSQLPTESAWDKIPEEVLF